MTSYWEMVPALRSMDGFSHRQRRTVSIPNMLSTSGRWNSATTQSISRPVLSVAQLLRQSIRSCLSRTYFGGTELQEDDLREALAKHAECWTDDSVYPSIAAAEVCRRVTMESEATAVDRINDVQSRLKEYFENLSATRVFLDTLGAYKRGRAAVTGKALVAGLNPPEFKLKIEHQLEIRGAWKDKPKEVFSLVREVAVAWHTVEMGDKQRHHTRTGRVNLRGQSSAKPFPGVSAGGAVDKASIVVVTCFECRKPGHLARNCRLHTFPSKGLLAARGGAGKRGSWVVHGAWTTAAAGAAAATTATPAVAATTTAALAAAAFLGASTRLDALFYSEEGSRGGIFDCFPSAPRWWSCGFLW